VKHYSILGSRSILFNISLTLLVILGVCADFADAATNEPPTPAAFLPSGMLGVQLGSNWTATKKTPGFEELTCQSLVENSQGLFDEVCYFKTATSSRVGGAAIHDAFMVGKADRVVLIGTGIAIKSAEDPLADSVIANFQAQIHTEYQHRGSHVLFASIPRKLSDSELQAYSQKVPVLLVQLETGGTELGVLYGYLAPVNAFDALMSD
jgi:hypothetical protein